MSLHPLLARVARSRHRIRSTKEVLKMPYPKLVKYCDSLLTPETAVHILLGCFEPEYSGTGRNSRLTRK